MRLQRIPVTVRAVRLALFFLIAGCSSLDPLNMTPGDDATPTDRGMPADTGTVDAGDPSDAGEADTLEEDAARPDAESPDAGPPCVLDQPAPADRDRVLIVGQPFTAVPGQDGTEIRSLSLSSAGALVDDGIRLDVGFRPARIDFTIDGQYALVLGENGEVASVRVESAQSMSLVDSVMLPPAGYGDLRVWIDGKTIFVVGSNVDTSSGISTLAISCDGALETAANEFYNVRLSDSLAFLPDPARAVLLGGQATFDPVDPDDVRLLEYTAGTGWTLIEAFDIYADFVDALRIAVSPDGSTLIVPNGSPFSNDGNTVSVVAISGATLAETVRLLDLEDAREALFSSDGRTVLVSLLTPGQIAVLADLGSGWAEVDRLSGIGLAENMAHLTRGQLADTVFVTSVDANGEPNVAIVRINGPGVATIVGMTNLGADSESIPVGIAVQP